MLSRSSTLPPTPAPAPTQVPPQEKQSGFKQTSALLSPTSLPVEKHRELPTSPVSVPIQATPSPTPTQPAEEERREPAAAETLNGNGSAVVGESPDVGMDSVEQGPGDMVERAPPTPAKDAAVNNRTMAPEPAPEGTSVAG